VIADFETDPKGWRFIGGWEFPGAKGSLTLDTSQAHGGKRSYRLDADFTGGGRYVGTWVDFKVLKDADLKEIHLWVKAGALKGLGIRFDDSTSQCHQSWVPLLPTPEWQELVLKFADLAGREHWGGANDGQLHLPVGGFGINLGTNEITTPGTKTASLWIDDVEGVPAHDRALMSVGAIQDPSFENQNQGNGKRLVLPWLSEGQADSGLDGSNGRGGSKCGYIFDGNGSGARSDIVQTISITPHTSYTLSCYIQTGDDFPAQGSVGARAPGGTILASQAFGLSKDYTQISVTFSSGTNTSVVIFAGFTSNAGKGGAWIHADDWKLVTASAK
jgi:hypothetical protein